MKAMPRILVVEDDPLFAAMLLDALGVEGYEVAYAETAEEALAALGEREYDAALLDVRLPDADGLGLFRALREHQPRCAVLVMTGYATVEAAVEAMREGALDYLAKPFPTEVALMKLKQILRVRTLEAELAALRAGEIAAGLVGRSRPFMEAMRAARAAAGTDASVLLTGESGTGKEHCAEMIHRQGPRHGGRLVKVSCGAVPSHLLDTELFGHEQKAFPAAYLPRSGALEQAAGGTLFLGEVDQSNPVVQARLAGAMRERRFTRVGGTRSLNTDFRLIAATVYDLSRVQQESVLREDFLQTVGVLIVKMPPLRERPEDIPLLVEKFVRELSLAHQVDPIRFAPEAFEMLFAHRWPGNVGELRLVVERLQVLHPGSSIPPRKLSSILHQTTPAKGILFEAIPTALPLREAVNRFEKRYISRVIEEEGDNKTAAARRLGVARETLWKKSRA